jgi:hypothetical protein
MLVPINLVCKLFGMLFWSLKEMVVYKLFGILFWNLKEVVVLCKGLNHKEESLIAKIIKRLLLMICECI